MSKNLFSKSVWLRILLIGGATALILLLLPKADHKSYNYELNQPWKYNLLTADFDMPIMRDSTSAKALRDSIDRSFIPFVVRNEETGKKNIAKFGTMARQYGQPSEIHILSGLLSKVYSDGVVDPGIYDFVMSQPNHELRTTVQDKSGEAIHTFDASVVLSPAKAYNYVDSAYMAQTGNQSQLSADMAKVLEICIRPNYELDSLTDRKFRNQEVMAVNAAMGVIKKGQRIVDKGEIVTSQIYTNLNVYTEMLARTQNDNTRQNFFIAGQAAYILICFGILYLFLVLYRPEIFSNFRQVAFIVSYITLFVIMAVVMFENFNSGLLLVPLAAVPVTVLVFFDSRTAIFSLGVTVLVTALVATFPFTFIFTQLLAGLVAVMSIHQLSRRSQLLRTALFTFVAYVLGTLTMYLVTEGNFDALSWRIIGYYAINSVSLSFAYILIFIIEKVFDLTSTVTLVELSDINNPLLRKLAQAAPGTFQHSMQVSTLAADAARAIGANTTLVRTGALYHDIGKMESPVFFTENQHGVNPHEGLDPEISAKKIISHVTSGMAMAQKAKLPRVVRNFITEHHGCGLTGYFYNTAVNNSNGGYVDASKFQYPGPNPQSRETAILMMADSVEAASRSLSEYTQQNIDTLVDRIIDKQMADGLLKESPISLKDIEIVKNAFKKRLATIYHTRVAYPTINKEPGNKEPGSRLEDKLQ